MTELLKIPREIRDKIYHQVARGVTIKHVSGLKDSSGKTVPRATAAVLLICSKQVHAEFQPIFDECVQYDITSLVDSEQGTLKLPLSPAALHHVSVDSEVFSGKGAMKLLKSMSNLKSLLYHGYHTEIVVARRLYARDSCVCTDGCDSCHSEEEILDILETDVNEQAGSMLGKCECETSGGYDEFECDTDHGIRKVISVWEYLEQPFTLTAQVNLIYASYNEATGYFDLGSKMMKVFGDSGNGKNYMGTFEVDLHNY